MDDETILSYRPEYDRTYKYYDPITGVEVLNKRSLLKSPPVIGGFMLTCYALGRGLFHLQTGDSRAQQKMMRLRVAAQMATVVAAYFVIKPIPVSEEQRALANEEFIQRWRYQERMSLEEPAPGDAGLASLASQQLP